MRLRESLNHILQIIASVAPGGDSWRVRLHKWRGVKFEGRTWIGQDVILETAFPERIMIGSNVAIGMRTIVIAHHGTVEDMSNVCVKIGKDVYIGPNCVVLPGVTIGDGAVVAAGSVVNRNVKSFTFVRGNPIRNEAKVTVPWGFGPNFLAFSRGLMPIKKIRKKIKLSE